MIHSQLVAGNGRQTARPIRPAAHTNTRTRLSARRALLAGIVVALTAAPGALAAERLDPAALEFFEKRIRPVLADNCYQCHKRSAEGGPRGGLALDTREGMLRGGDSGPALIAGDPDASLFIQAIRHTRDDLKMPGDADKLPSEQIAALEEWVRMGAPDPRTGAVAPTDYEIAWANHWAFQRIENAEPPPVKGESWVQTSIDRFILAKLEANSMKPSPPADRRALLRRASYDLTGLPPTPEEVEAFLQDESAEAFAQVVDRLLASPQYGERWGRHWLDVARYADTKGYVFEEERRFPFSYTYRDYVIRAFNEDLPFDRFIIEQIAADHLDLGEDKRALAGLGFLTLGRRFLNNQHDIIDDRIDVVSRGFLGLTVSCARCHDHKHDPISIRDYYSLYGVFASSVEPSELPLLGAEPDPNHYEAYLEEKRRREDELKNFRESNEAKIRTQIRKQAGEYLLAAHDAGMLSNTGQQEALARERQLDPGLTQRWIRSLEGWGKEHHPVFAPWFAFAALEEAEFAARAGELSSQFAANKDEGQPLNALVANLFSGEPPQSIQEVAERYGELFTEVEDQWQERISAENAERPAALEDADRESLRQVLYARGAPTDLDSGQIARIFDVPTIQRVRALGRRIAELDATHPGAPPRAMALVDRDKPREPHVFVRGNPGNRGPVVPRQFLEILSGEDRQPFQKGSGRLEMAEAIANPDNPLTARVIVNRVWLNLFGQGIVRTPSDFGLHADAPTHPELLDYLAGWFIENGWSIKKLNRKIMLSSVYQQGSEQEPRYATLDADNQLLWRMNRQRLDFESMRDSFLAVSGTLDLGVGGRPVDIITRPFSTRRTVYGFIDRQNLPGMFRTFDFANPDATSPQRFYTTVPQQALFLMNSPFMADQARSLIARLLSEGVLSEEEKIGALYETLYQRSPGAEELRLGLAFVNGGAAEEPEMAAPVWQYGYGAYDSAAQRVSDFTHLPHFTGSGWQGGTDLPDGALGWVLLTAEGGHAGNHPQHAAIRRWTSPLDGMVRVTSTFGHQGPCGDGVRGRIVSSRSGLLGEWSINQQSVETTVEEIEVQTGDTVDFVVDLGENGNLNCDSFTWAPVIQAIGSGGRWHAQGEFGGPEEPIERLDPWEQYAQVLLLANEFAFVD